MANTHPANLGDVMKHLFLCEALAEQPLTYVESHAGAFSYDLGEVPDPGPGGIWDFAQMAASDPVLADSAYARIAVPLAGTRRDPGAYLGSIGLANELLAPACRIIAAETNAVTSAALDRALADHSREASIMDKSVEGQDVIAAQAERGCLVLVDPFNVHAKSRSGLSSRDAFAEAVSRGATAYLWYPLVRENETATWASDLLEQSNVRTVQMEIHYPAKAAGLWGCGLVVAGHQARFPVLWTSLQHGLSAIDPSYHFVTAG